MKTVIFALYAYASMHGGLSATKATPLASYQDYWSCYEAQKVVKRDMRRSQLNSGDRATAYAICVREESGGGE